MTKPKPKPVIYLNGATDLRRHMESDHGYSHKESMDPLGAIRREHELLHTDSSPGMVPEDHAHERF